VRIGTWNLGLRSTSPTPDWANKAAWLDEQEGQLWLLTEVHQSWDSRGNAFAVSPERSRFPDKGRWAGIETSCSLTQLPMRTEGFHPADEGLVLARVRLGSMPVLVACSVLPWNGAGEYWNGLPAPHLDQYRSVLDRHVARIATERLPGESLIWGGDFNQPLVPPFFGGSKDEALALRSALEFLGLTSLTQGLAHRDGAMHAIDHLAVSPHFVAERAEVYRPRREDDSRMSDHAAYTADIRASACNVYG